MDPKLLGRGVKMSTIITVIVRCKVQGGIHSYFFVSFPSDVETRGLFALSIKDLAKLVST